MGRTISDKLFGDIIRYLHKEECVRIYASLLLAEKTEKKEDEGGLPTGDAEVEERNLGDK